MLQKYNKKTLFLLVVFLLAVLIYPYPTRAGWLDFAFSNSTLGAIVNGIVNLILNFTEKAISFFADLFDKSIQWQTGNVIYGVIVVDQSWKIVRNFVNMFFILILIIMAFGTIFDIQKYTWREMLAPFLIAALLVNFSLTIGQYIITVANGLSSVFLRQIGAVSDTFAQGFSVVGIATSGSTDLISGTGEVIITVIFAIIFLTVVMLAFAAAAIFTLVRIFVLWFLLIISPIAWIGYSLPNLRGRTWSTWWNHFFCWCFFLPYYLFFVMFAVIFIKNRSTIPPIPGSSATAGVTGNDFMFYTLSLIFLIGGLGVARKMACASGTGIKTVFGKIEGGVKRYFPGAAYVRGAWEGVKARGEEIKERGILGIGGAQRAREAEARMKGWVAGLPGPGRVPGARETAQRALVEETDKEIKKLQLLNLTLDQLNEKLKSKNLPERLAAFRLKAENGWLAPSDVNEINRLMKELGGGMSPAGASLLNSLRKGHFHEMAVSTEEKERIFDALTDLETRKAFGLDMAESGEIINADLAKKLLDLYKGGTLEERQRVENAIRKNIKNFIRTKNERAAFLVDQTQDKTIRRLLAQQMSEDGEINTYTKYKAAVDLFGGENQPASRAMLEKITKDDPITHAEIQFRQELGLQDPTKLNPTYTPTSTEIAGLIPKYHTKMQRMSASQIANIERDKWTPEFEAALQSKINDLEAVEPTQPAIPPVIDPKTRRVIRKGRKEIPGAGKRFIQTLRREVISDPHKLAIVNRLKV